MSFLTRIVVVVVGKRTEIIIVVLTHCFSARHCSRRVLLIDHTSSLLSTEAYLFHSVDLVPTLRFVPLGGGRGRIHRVVACPELHQKLWLYDTKSYG